MPEVAFRGFFTRPGEITVELLVVQAEVGVVVFVDDGIDSLVGDLGGFRVRLAVENLPRDVDVDHPEALRDRPGCAGGHLLTK